MIDPPDRELAVFSAARLLHPGERGAYLDQACAGDTALRQRIEELLRAGDEAGAFLDQPATGAQRTEQAADASDPRHTMHIAVAPAEKSGDRIGRYKLLQQIGEGGCGVVYMAEQQEPVRRMVALKVIKLGMDTKSVIARFEAERQALALMDHPNIAKVLEAGATETGRPYFVMELVRGIKITDYCDQHNLPTRERLNLFVQVCQAIQHAHQKGVIHRDIKPSNILVTLRDGVPVPKVIDFGIAKATTDQRLTDKTLFTAFEQFIGTPAYMSPEQAEMSELGIDTRSDIYSLGVLLYELLTGQTPFDAKELLQGGLDAMRRIIREKEPSRPSTRLSTLLQAELTNVANHRQTEAPKLVNLLRGDLDWIVIKSLEKDRTRRYETADGLAMDIKRHLSYEAVLARPPSGLYRFQKLVRRNKLSFIAAAILTGMLFIGMVAASIAVTRIARDSKKIKRANAEARESLWSSYLAEARARRSSRQAGQRFASMEAVQKASAIHSSFDLRNEAIACLAVSDVRPIRQIRFREPVAEPLLCFDSKLEQYAIESDQGSLIIRRAEDDRELAQLPASGATLTKINLFSPDGRFLSADYAIAGEGTKTCVWDLQQRIMVFKESAEAPAFSPDSQLLAWCDPAGGICIRSLESTNVARRLVMDERFSGLGFDFKGARLVCMREGSRLIEIRDAASGQLIRSILSPSPMGSMDWSDDGKLLAAGCHDCRIYLWNAEDGQLLATLEGHADSVVGLGFNPTGTWLASSSWDGTMRIWDTVTGRPFLSTSGGARQVQFSPDGKRLAISQEGFASFGLLEVAESQEFRRFNSSRTAGGGRGPAFSADGNIVAVALEPGAVRFWDVNSGKEVASFMPSSIWDTMVFHPDGKSLITAERTRAIYSRALERTPDQRAYKLGKPRVLYADAGLREATLSANGRFLAMADFENGQGIVLDLENPSAPVMLRGDAMVDKLVVSPDGRWAASSSWHYPEVRVWDAKTGNRVCTLTMPTRASAAFSPDGRWLATASTEYQLWEVGSWQKRNLSVAGHPIPHFNYVAFSPDSRMMAIITAERRIQLLDTLSTRPLATLEAPDPSRPLTLSFSPDGRRLAALEASQQLAMWDLRLLRARLQDLGLDWRSPPYSPSQEPQATGTLTLDIEADGEPQGSRAALLGGQGQWKEASIAAVKALEILPGDYMLYHTLAPLLARQGDLVRYRQTCREIFAQFANYQDPFAAGRLARDCLILPVPGMDFDAVDRWATTAVNLGADHRYLTYFLCVKGLVEYRQGHFANALDWMHKSLANSHEPPGEHGLDAYLHVDAQSVLAMAHFQLQQKPEALNAFNEAFRTARENLPGLEHGNLTGVWRDWIVAHALLSEAEALLGPIDAGEAK